MAGAVLKAIQAGDPIVFGALFLHHCGIQHGTLTFVNGAGFIQKTAVAPQPFIGAVYAKFPQAEVQRQEIIFVAGLQVVADGIPAVILRTLDEAGPHRVQIKIGQAVDQGFTVSISFSGYPGRAVREMT